MRPTVQRDDTSNESGRIIYLGDVRRRRAGRTRAPDRHYLAALLIAAIVAWSLWLVVLLALPPSRLLSYAAFFAPLWAALSATIAGGSYAVEWRRGVAPGLRRCVRRGVLLSTALVVNLALQAAHHWTLIACAVSLMMVAAADVAWSHKERS